MRPKSLKLIADDNYPDNCRDLFSGRSREK